MLKLLCSCRKKIRRKIVVKLHYSNLASPSLSTLRISPAVTIVGSMPEHGDGISETIDDPSHGKSESKTQKISRDDVMALIREKDRIVSRINELEELLRSESEVGMSGPLLDADGYPRSDIDVYSVRHARHDIICLNNDHTAIMKRIEEGLYALHAQAREEQMVVDEDPANSVAVAKPFAKITLVSTESPAAKSGLEVGDLVTAFGTVNSNNFRSLRDIATVVNNSENRSINVEILRQGMKKRVTITPTRWSGQGLLGCSFVEEKVQKENV